tara:strand:- start:1314 stop:2030 length:717 start_codon:yes stop_codon:yes gene_type:complete
MTNKFKLILATIYALGLGLLLYFVFSNFDLSQINNYAYIKENSLFLVEFKNSQLILFTILFFTFAVIWILFLGFGSPIAIVSGFIFGKWYGTIISVFSFSIGSSLLYILASFYFKDFVIKNFSKKIEKYKNLFNKNEFLYFMIFRFAGGGGIPFGIQNVLPVIFDMKIKNYFFSTFIGLIPTVFIINSLGSGVESLIEDNDTLTFSDVLFAPEIYLPITCFLILIFLSLFLKNKFFKN